MFKMPTFAAPCQSWFITIDAKNAGFGGKMEMKKTVVWK